MVTTLDFHNYLTRDNLSEVVDRVRNIFGDPNVRFAVALTTPGASIPDLYTHQKVFLSEIYEDYMQVGPDGFTVFGQEVLTFGASTDHDTVAQAARAEREGKAHTFIKIFGGTGRNDILNQSITIRGLNSYGVPFSTVVKVEDHGTEELAKKEASVLRAVATRLKTVHAAPQQIVEAVLNDANGVEYDWKSRLNQF